jgi:hypothetical protein
MTRGYFAAGLCLGTIGAYEQGAISGARLLPRLPSMAAAFVMKRKEITKAEKAERAKEPPPAPVVKIRIAKPR